MSAREGNSDAPLLVRRAASLSHHAADAGHSATARRAWRLAERLSGRCGGISGIVARDSGHSAIVLADGYVAYSPGPAAWPERRCAAGDTDRWRLPAQSAATDFRRAVEAETLTGAAWLAAVALEKLHQSAALAPACGLRLRLLDLAARAGNALAASWTPGTSEAMADIADAIGALVEGAA